MPITFITRKRASPTFHQQVQDVERSQTIRLKAFFKEVHMSNPGFETFDTTVQKTNELLSHGWNVNQVPIKMNRQEFVQAVREQFPFSVEGDIEEVIRAVVESLEDQIDQNQVEKVKELFPQDLRALMQS